MTITATLAKGNEEVAGTLRRNFITIGMDSSYPDGGEALTARQLGLNTVKTVQDLNVGGYTLHYDIANSKLQAFQQGPALVTEDTGAFTAGAAYTLKKLPGFVLSIRGTAGSTGVKRIIPTGETVSAGQAAITWTTGVITWGDAAITRAIITYIPRGVPGFSTNLLVIDEAVTLADAGGGLGSGTLANRAAAIAYVWDDEDNTVLTYIPVGETPSGAQCAIDINSTGSTIITVETAAIGNGAAKLKVTYLKFTGNPLTAGLNWRDQTDWVVTSDTLGPGTDSAWDVAGVVIPAFGQVIVGETGAAANKQAILVDAAGSTAANVAVHDPSRNTIAFTAGDGYATVEIPLLYYNPALHGVVREEVQDGTDLSALTGALLVAEGY